MNRYMMNRYILAACIASGALGCTPLLARVDVETWVQPGPIQPQPASQLFYTLRPTPVHAGPGRRSGIISEIPPSQQIAVIPPAIYAEGRPWYALPGGGYVFAGDVTPVVAAAPAYTVGQCAPYSQTVGINGRAVPVVGTACLGADGAWRLINRPDLPALPPPVPASAPQMAQPYYPPAAPPTTIIAPTTTQPNSAAPLPWQGQ